MSVLPKEVVQEIIKGDNFQTPQEIMAFLKESFKDVLQEMLEAEMDVHLGYSKGEEPPSDVENTRNGYSSKTVGSELGPIELDITRDRKGEYNPKIVLIFRYPDLIIQLLFYLTFLPYAFIVTAKRRIKYYHAFLRGDNRPYKGKIKANDSPKCNIRLLIMRYYIALFGVRFVH